MSSPRCLLPLRVFVLLLLGMLAGCTFARGLEIHALALTVGDLDRAVAFYESALGFRKVETVVVADGEHDQISGVFGARVRRATLRLGSETIELEQYLAAAGAPVPADTGSTDQWFQHFAIVVRDMDAAVAQLARHRVQPISSAPQTIPQSNAAAAGIRAYKFKDPDGHPLELLYFPPGKGDPRWQRPGETLFIGIDHSAITIADTDRSLRFWSELLGLQVVGTSLNSGETQEALDATPGARVRITGLRPLRSGGPGLEFLQYLNPSTGRAAAAGSRPNDQALTRVVLEVEDLDRLVERLTEQGSAFVSARPARLRGSPFARGLIVKDPDGHAVMLVQR